MNFLTKLVLTLVLVSTGICREENKKDHGKKFSENLTKNIRHVRSMHQQTEELSSRYGNLTVLERWQTFENKLKDLSNGAIKSLLPHLMENNGGTKLSGQCMKEFMLLMSGIKKIKPWAIKFIDSSAKMFDGLFEGTLSTLGMFDECLEIKVPGERSKDKGKTIFTGQYCTVELRLPVPKKTRYYKFGSILPELKNFSKGGTVVSEAAEFAELMNFVSFHFALCVPSGCKLEDVNEIALKIGDFIGLDTRASRCEIQEKVVFSTAQIFILCLFSLLLFLVFVATIVGLYFYFKGIEAKNTPLRILLCFDFVQNFKRLTDTDSSSDTLTCLNGFRFITMCWVILGHTYLNINHHMFLGMKRAQDFAKDFAFQPIINSLIAVDTFYAISGLLVCYLTVKLVKIQKRPFNIMLYVVHRIWRILPVYMAVIGIVILSNHLGSGPMFYETGHRFIKACEKHWWTNVLFINNFRNIMDLCMPQSWYVASDMQLYIGALIILLPMIRSSKVGLSICVCFILACIVYTGVATHFLDLPYTLSFSRPDPDLLTSYIGSLQFRPFVHIGPYCIGIIAGYILATKPKLKFSKTILLGGWCVAFVFGFSAVYGTYEWNKGYDPTVVDGYLFSSLQRSMWAFAVCWVIVCCSTGNGGIVNHILSWQFFIPLGRLTYSTFLIHPIVQVVFMANIRTLLQPDNMIGVLLYFGSMCTSYLLGFALSIFIESPSVAIQKLMENMGKESRVSREKKEVVQMTMNGDVAVIMPNA